VKRILLVLLGGLSVLVLLGAGENYLGRYSERQALNRLASGDPSGKTWQVNVKTDTTKTIRPKFHVARWGWDATALRTASHGPVQVLVWKGTVAAVSETIYVPDKYGMSFAIGGAAPQRSGTRTSCVDSLKLKAVALGGWSATSCSAFVVWAVGDSLAGRGTRY
jgi:hypothetical protein